MSSEKQLDKPERSMKCVGFNEKITHHGKYTVTRSRDGQTITRKICR